MNADNRSFVLVIIIGLAAALVIGALIIIDLVGQDETPAATEQAIAQTTSEATETGETGDTAETSPAATAEETAEGGEEATAEATTVTNGADATSETMAEATEGAEQPGAEAPSETDGAASEGETGGATPTSVSRVMQSILMGNEPTPVTGLMPEATTPQPANGEGQGTPTPTSLSRVPQSIILGEETIQPATAEGETGTMADAAAATGTEATAEATSEGAEATAEATTDAGAEATPEATEAAAGGAAAIGDSQSGAGSGDESGSQPLPSPVPGRPQSAPSALESRGPIAERIETEWWIMLIMATLIYIYVLWLVLKTLIRRQPNVDEQADSPERQRNFLVINGFAMPIVVLTIVFAFTIGTLAVISAAPTELTIEVTGQQWWWEVRYPDEGIVTANEIHIPVGQPVRFVLRSDNVIHSFWVPELGGKMDLIPGRTNAFWLQADEPGEYRGQCAEYCGVQHAKMAFLVIANTPEEYAAWVEQQRQPAREPDANSLAAQGQQVFLNSECIACHTIRGTDAQGVQGPDLTHLASRRTLAAGTIPNTRGHLAGWIVDAQAIKPGNLMPPQDVGSEQLHALLAYLTGLE